MKHRLLGGLFVAAACLSAEPAAAQGWGSLKGQFVYDGAPPQAAVVNAGGVQGCGMCKLVDESVVVDPTSGGLKNVVVYLRGKASAVHPDYADLKNVEAAMDNKCCRFEPHVVALTVGQTLVLGNPDAVAHNVNGSPLNDTPFNPLIPAGGSQKHVFGREQRLPVPVACNIHPWMKGYVLPRENPYFAVTDKDGRFEIKNLPAGDLDFQVWQESTGYLVAKPEWVLGKAKGVVSVKIADGKTEDLGTVKVSPKLFK